MITYELAKEMKEKGFRQPAHHPDYKASSLQWIEDCYIPTLSELIEAVKNHPMNRKDVGLYTKSNTEYVAWARKTNLDPVGDGDRQCSGSTPEEAVARLWLALQKK